MIRRPPRSTLFPYRRSSDLQTSSQDDSSLHTNLFEKPGKSSRCWRCWSPLSPRCFLTSPSLTVACCLLSWCSLGVARHVHASPSLTSVLPKPGPSTFLSPWAVGFSWDPPTDLRVREKRSAHIPSLGKYHSTHTPPPPSCLVLPPEHAICCFALTQSQRGRHD